LTDSKDLPLEATAKKEASKGLGVVVKKYSITGKPKANVDDGSKLEKLDQFRIAKFYVPGNETFLSCQAQFKEIKNN
jgi:hypothetical protein